MTDEQKAEEYVDKLLCDEKCSFLIGKEKIKNYILKVYLDALECCKKSYEKGLAEGRKEIFPSFTKKKEMLETKVSILEEEIERLKAQIEKMMRCANCKHRAVGNDKLPCSECDGKNKWEIME